MTRAAIYARVSSQAQRESHTIENQLRTLPAYVLAQGWEIAGTYIDDGRSAKSGKARRDARVGLTELLRDAELKKFDVLVVVDVDRLTRSDDMMERAQILGPFQRLGIDIVTPAGGRLDMRSMLGELYVTLQAQFAAEENRKRAERIIAGKARAIAENRKPAGPTPFGWTYTRATGTWEVNEATAPIVREIVRRVAEGDTCQAIADDLNRRDLKPPKALQWTQENVYRIVRSSAAMGDWIVHKKHHSVVRIPALVTDGEWQAAQRSLLSHRRRGLRKTKHVYLLEGLARCGHCGDPIAIRSACGGPKKNQPAYVCRRRKRDQKCFAPIVKTPDIDEAVWAAICDEIMQPELMDALADRQRERAADGHDWASDAEGYRDNLGRLDRVEATFMAKFRRDQISEGALDIELAALGRDRKFYRDQLATAERAFGANVSAKERLAAASNIVETLRAALPHATPEQRRALIVELLPGPPDGWGATITDGKVTIDLRLPRGDAAGAAYPSSLVGVSDNSAGYRTQTEQISNSTLRIRRRV